MPTFRKIGRKNLCLQHEAEAYVAAVFDLPAPPQPQEIKLLTPGEFAAMLRRSKHTIRKDIARQARQAAAEPNRAA
jgi:hypothetical protein